MEGKGRRGRGGGVAAGRAKQGLRRAKYKEVTKTRGSAVLLDLIEALEGD